METYTAGVIAEVLNKIPKDSKVFIEIGGKKVPIEKVTWDSLVNELDKDNKDSKWAEVVLVADLKEQG